jgi:hypothetical protein
MDPVRLRLQEFRGATPTGAGLVCVYRTRHARAVTQLVAQALKLEMAIALWALDAPAPGLLAQTIGCGPGTRLQLLNRLCEALPSSAGGPLVVCDDDIAFVRGGLRELLALTSTCDFGLAQPAHAPGSYVNHAITRARPLTLARVTTFVECGPAVVISREWRSRILPFPEELGMGWGLNLLWSDLQQLGCRLGIIDSVSLRHLAPTAHSYDVASEAERLRLLMKARGIEHIVDSQHTAQSWRAWRGEPPWGRTACSPPAS